MESLLEKSNDGDYPRPLTENDLFYRAIHPDWIKEDGKVSSAAFSNASQTNRMSVDWAARSTPQETFDRWPQWGDCRGVASITAGVCCQNDQKIEYTPKEDNCAHSDIVGKKTDRIRRNFAKSAKLLIPSPNPIPCRV